ncbi:MAG: hypothetical protein ACAH88_10970 [Roseimicrobium sp.]
MKTTRLLLFRKLTRLLLAVLSVVVTHTWQPKALAEGECELCGLYPAGYEPPFITQMRNDLAAKNEKMWDLLEQWQSYHEAAQNAAAAGNTTAETTWNSLAAGVVTEMTALLQQIQLLEAFLEWWANLTNWCVCPPEEECPTCYLLVSLCICPPEDTCPTCYELVSACTCPPPEESCPNCYQLVSACICQTCATCYNLIASCTCPPPETCPTCSNLIASCTCPPPEQTCVNCNQVVSQCICSPLP